MEDLDIYGDLDFLPVSKEDEIVKSEKYKSLQSENASLRNSVDDLRREVEELRKANENLKRNIGSLHATAKAEIERRNRQLGDLQNQYDALLFRRGSAGSDERPFLAAIGSKPPISTCTSPHGKSAPSNSRPRSPIEREKEKCCVDEAASKSSAATQPGSNVAKTPFRTPSSAQRRESHRPSGNTPSFSASLAQLRPRNPPRRLDDAPGGSAEENLPATKQGVDSLTLLAQSINANHGKIEVVKTSASESKVKTSNQRRSVPERPEHKITADPRHAAAQLLRSSPSSGYPNYASVRKEKVLQRVAASAAKNAGSAVMPLDEILPEMASPPPVGRVTFTRLPSQPNPCDPLGLGRDLLDQHLDEGATKVNYGYGRNVERPSSESSCSETTCRRRKSIDSIEAKAESSRALLPKRVDEKRRHNSREDPMRKNPPPSFCPAIDPGRNMPSMLNEFKIPKIVPTSSQCPNRSATSREGEIREHRRASHRRRSRGSSRDARKKRLEEKRGGELAAVGGYDSDADSIFAEHPSLFEPPSPFTLCKVVIGDADDMSTSAVEVERRNVDREKTGPTLTFDLKAHGVLPPTALPHSGDDEAPNQSFRDGSSRKEMSPAEAIAKKSAAVVPKVPSNLVAELKPCGQFERINTPSLLNERVGNEGASLPRARRRRGRLSSSGTQVTSMKVFGTSRDEDRENRVPGKPKNNLELNAAEKTDTVDGSFGQTNSAVASRQTRSKLQTQSKGVDGADNTSANSETVNSELRRRVEVAFEEPPPTDVVAVPVADIDSQGEIIVKHESLPQKSQSNDAPSPADRAPAAENSDQSRKRTLASVSLSANISSDSVDKPGLEKSVTSQPALKRRRRCGNLSVSAVTVTSFKS